MKAAGSTASRRWTRVIGAAMAAIWLAWTGLAIACMYEARSPHLVCLLYHRFASSADYAAISDAQERVYTISSDKFDEQMASLVRQGFRAVGLDEAVAFVNGMGTIPDRAVLLTIDDGSRNVASVAGPVLRRHGYQATVFITTDPAAYVFASSVPGSERLSDDEIRNLDPAIWHVGGHGHTHKSLRDMTDAALAAELKTNRESLAALLPAPPVAMAVPGNWSGPSVRAIAPTIGYTHVFVSDAGFIHPGDDRTALPRINVSGKWSLRGFERAVSLEGVSRRRVGRVVRRAMSYIVGDGLAAMAARWLRATLPTEAIGMLTGQAIFATVAMLVYWRMREQRRLPGIDHTCQPAQPG